MRQTRCSREIARNVEGNPQASSMITHEDFHLVLFFRVRVGNGVGTKEKGVTDESVTP